VGNLVLMETVKFFRMTSDEAPLHGGGGKNNAPFALPQQPALNWFQGRLLLPVLALGGLFLLLSCATNGARRHYDAGNSLLKQGKLTAAQKEFREAVRLRPDFAEAHFALGIAIHDAEEYKHLAEPEYREAIRLKPNYPEAHYRLGCLLVEERKYDEAVQEYREAIRLKPDYLWAIEQLANTLDLFPMSERPGSHKEARLLWERALKLTKDPKRRETIKQRLAEPDAVIRGWR